MASTEPSISGAGYDHQYSVLNRSTSLGNVPATASTLQSRRNPGSNFHTSSSAVCMEPTWRGFVHTTLDALMVLEGCLQGRLQHIPRRPHDRERANIITGGNVFIYEENASGIKRWTDGVTWSPSRIMGNFLVYRELNEPFPAGEKKKAKKRKRGSEDPEGAESTIPLGEEDRKLVGSLVDSYGFKADGLIKKTLNVKYNHVNHHIVAYYTLKEIKDCKYRRPQFDTETFSNGDSIMEPRRELLDYNFKVPISEQDDVDPFRETPLGGGGGGGGHAPQNYSPQNYAIAGSNQAHIDQQNGIQHVSAHHSPHLSLPANYGAAQMSAYPATTYAPSQMTPQYPTQQTPPYMQNTNYMYGNNPAMSTISEYPIRRDSGHATQLPDFNDELLGYSHHLSMSTGTGMNNVSAPSGPTHALSLTHSTDNGHGSHNGLFSIPNSPSTGDIEFGPGSLGPGNSHTWYPSPNSASTSLTRPSKRRQTSSSYATYNLPHEVLPAAQMGTAVVNGLYMLAQGQYGMPPRSDRSAVLN